MTEKYKTVVNVTYVTQSLLKMSDMLAKFDMNIDGVFLNETFTVYTENEPKTIHREELKTGFIKLVEEKGGMVQKITVETEICTT